MFHIKYLLYVILIQHLINGIPQINLYYTDEVSEYENNDIIQQHNCLRIIISTKETNIIHQLISYCMSESLLKFHVENDTNFPRFSFSELAKQNITSQQLYHWSASIDIIERYQDYLNQSSISNNLTFEKEFFYNCTLPRFGSRCQYELYYYHSNYTSLYEIIHDFYRNYEYNPTELTCYNYLKCNRGYFPSCLDWSEICDGKVDCLDGNFDEEHCWQLEINICQDNEYQCSNGQCIPQVFFQDDLNNPDCIDGSDEPKNSINIINECSRHEPSFKCEDRICQDTFLTNSCVMKRRDLLKNALYSIKDDSVSNECWSAFKCILSVTDSTYSFNDKSCSDIIEKSCPDMLYVPNVPILFGHIYTAYTRNHAQSGGVWELNPPYICYNHSRYDDFFDKTTKILFNNETCFLPEVPLHLMIISFLWNHKYERQIINLYKELKKFTTIGNYTSAICNQSNMYQCINSSKCIPKFRLMDTIHDCPHEDDEIIFQTGDINNIIEDKRQDYYECEASDIYIHQILIDNGQCDCGNIHGLLCEDEDLNYIYSRINISFQTICDGYTELIPINIFGRNETDETECEQWECNNIYTRCDGIWNCLNGQDEIECNLFTLLNCTLTELMCVSPHTNQFMCLPNEQVNDGKVDCLGGTDEQELCKLVVKLTIAKEFYCTIDGFPVCLTTSSLCDENKQCDNGDDEQFCEKNLTVSLYDNICQTYYLSSLSDIMKFFCHLTKSNKWEVRKYFTFDGIITSTEDEINNIKNPIVSSSSIIEMSDQYEPRCHRGLDLRVWLNNENNLTINTCLCPPSYYGSKCQYQNERISLTLKFRVLSDSLQTLFEIVILLIDDNDKRIIHSYEQLSYLSIRDCKIKYQIYLIYSTRPKNQSKNYFIHIDIYEKISMIYRGSLLFPINYSFLPVHRLSYIINIPESDNNLQSCSNQQCNHGKCIKYSNNKHMNYCQCEKGWYGLYCNISYQCKCSLDSLCIGITANNQSICICPINKFGSRCFIVNTICQNLTCKNNGQCIPIDEYIITNQNFFCICPKGFSGDRCEIIDKKIILSFEKSIISSESIFIHFIQVIKNNIPMRATTFKTISIIKNSVEIYWSRPFHLIFIEFFNKIYYLSVIQNISNRSISIVKMINSSNHCPHINKLFNETFMQLHLIRRIKYYHISCQNISLNLSCFHDDKHLCLCYNYNQKRLSNCFDFDHNMTFDCFGQSECQNDGQCFQDQPDCPQRSMCICRLCYYGRKCQFSTSGFGLSLDAILGYHIIPNINIKNQSSIIKFSLILTIIFILVGFINGILTLITFKNKIIREVGCGLYLLCSSITTLVLMILFGLKFSILILTQMKIIQNRLFLKIQCISLDFLLQVSLNMNQWLNSCVAIERAITAMKGIHFNKKQSKKIAKLVIIIVLIIIICTFIYDPIYRNLIDEENNDDNNQKRIWCIVTYSSSLKIFNSIIHTFHFIAPFIINLISSIILITKKSHQQSNLQTRRTYKELLQEQFRQHKHLFTAPIVLVILALPRLIIIFVSKCMKSVKDSWLFLIGYFISFIPSIVTFLIFILPSKFYKKEFNNSVVRYRTSVRRRLNMFS